MFEIGLAYSDEILKASIPSGNLKIVERRSYPPLRNWQEDVRIDLDSPIGVEPLEKTSPRIVPCVSVGANIVWSS